MKSWRGLIWMGCLLTIVSACGGGVNTTSIIDEPTPSDCSLSPTAEPVIACSQGATYYFTYYRGGRLPREDAATFKPIAAMGATWSRIDLNKTHALAEGEGSTRRLARPFVDQALRNGLRMVVTLIEWEKPPRTESEMADWKTWVQEVATEFRVESSQGRIVWNIWNEPEGVSWGSRMTDPVQRAREYVAVVKATSEALRSVDPTAMTMGPTTAWGSPDLYSFFRECKRLGIEDYLTFIDVHPSKTASSEDKRVNSYQDPESIWGRDKAFGFYGRYAGWPHTLDELRELFPSKKLTFSEWPYSMKVHPSGASKLTAAENQSASSLRAYLISLGENVPIHLQWEFQEEFHDPVKGDPYFIDTGIRDRSESPRPVYYVWKEFLTTYRGWRAEEQAGSAKPSKIVIDHPGCYRLLIVSPDGLRRKSIRWGVAGNAFGYPEIPQIEDSAGM